MYEYFCLIITAVLNVPYQWQLVGYDWELGVEKPHKIYYLGSDTIIRHRINAAALFYNDKKLYMQNKLDYVNQ